ncbi:BldC family transcriptional regulator (plasmid) [Nonomuraea gerenzanensis]|nr:BldC family transcriptional regulator [Nonomuraea gerenzanensis]UBU19224.1 BldC family transcriptional regulator [Nonomuraea gerenzanensis]
MTPDEVARLFRVHPTTVTRWAKRGHLRAIRTPGGLHRFPPSEVVALLVAAGAVAS